MTPHLSAVTMPPTPLRDRPDYAELVEAIRRAGDSAVARAFIAARFKLPYALVDGLAGRVGE